MNTTPPTPSTPSTAVWYFVVATFVFVSPSLFFRDGGLWVSIITLLIGAAVFGVGVVVFQRELAAARAADPRNPGSSDDPPARDPG